MDGRFRIYIGRAAVCIMCAAVLSVFPTASARCADQTAWSFEHGTGGWTAADRGATAGIVEDAVSDAGKKNLRVTIAGTPGPLLARTEPIPMKTREFYRLSALMRVEGLRPGEPIPRLACYYEGAPEGSWLGEGAASPYDTTRPGTWQRVSGEFRVPFGTVRGRIVIAAGRLNETAYSNAAVSLDDIKLEPIPHYTIDTLYRLDPMPAELERMHGVHPRMFLTPGRLAALKQAIKTTHKPLWDEVLAKTDKLVDRDAPDYMGEDEFSNIEQLYMRGNGESMTFLALAWAVTGEKKYLDAAERWALKVCSYPTWGLYEFANVDLSTGHQLLGLSLVYDWCFDGLSPETKAVIRRTLVEKASFLFDVAAKGIIVKDAEAYKQHPWPEWDEAYLQNHSWINSCGLAAAGFAVFDETDAEATRWMAFTLDRYRRTMNVLGPDGASHEGPGYWSYGVEWMLKFMYMARDLLGVDMFDHPWWRNTASYRLYMGLPMNSWTYSNTTVDVGDSRRYDWYGPDYMLRLLASEYRDGHAQWLADATDKANVAHPVASWLNMLWYDPSVSPIPPSNLPTLKRFDDMDIASMRSDWSGDEAFIFYKSGPYIGHTAIRTFTYCPSSAHHVHPDTGNFMLFGNGEWLIVDDGYRAKYTGYHNTLLIDGGEQLGGGYPIFNGAQPHGLQARPRIVTTQSGPRLDHCAGDATEAYPPDSGLRKFVRHLLFVKPDILIVVDDIAAAGEHNFELRFHPERQESVRDGAAYVMRGEKAVLRLDPLTVSGITMRDEPLIMLPKESDGKDLLRYTIRLSTRGETWRNAVALTWSDSGSEPGRVKLERTGGTWRFVTERGTVVFDWKTGSATME